MTRNTMTTTDHHPMLDGGPVVCRSRRFRPDDVHRDDESGYVVLSQHGSEVRTRFRLPASEQLRDDVLAKLDAQTGTCAFELAPRATQRGAGWLDITYYVTGVEAL